MLHVVLVRRDLDVFDTASRRRARLDAENRKAGNARHGRREQNREFGGRECRLGVVREIGDEDRHGEADAAEHRRADHVPPVDVLGQLGKPRLHDDGACQQDADGLAREQTEEHAQKRRAAKDGGDVARDAHVGVGQREQRQNQEVHPRVQRVFQARRRWDDLTRHRGQAAHAADVLLLADKRLFGVERGLCLANLLSGPIAEALEVDARAGRDGKREQHAGDGRMNARQVHAQPEDDAKPQVRDERVDVRAVERDEQRERDRGGEQPLERRRVTVEDRDDEDCDDVVGNGERREEHADARRDATAQKRHDAERERDVCRRRHAPPARGVRVAGVDGTVDDNRCEHAAHCRDDGEQGLTDVGELAHRHLVLDFEADEQEEQRHEDVVDDVHDAHRVCGIADDEADLEVGELEQHLVRRRVGEHERGDGGEEHDTGGLGRGMRERDYLLVARLVAVHLIDEQRVGWLLGARSVSHGSVPFLAGDGRRARGRRACG